MEQKKSRTSCIVIAIVIFLLLLLAFLLLREPISKIINPEGSEETSEKTSGTGNGEKGVTEYITQIIKGETSEGVPEIRVEGDLIYEEITNEDLVEVGDDIWVNTEGDRMSGDLILEGDSSLTIQNASNLIIGEVTLSSDSSASGASVIGVYDEFDNSSSQNVQDVLKDLDEAISQGVAQVDEVDPIFTSSPAAGITTTNISNWNTAYGWGNHASAGYLTSESDPIFSASAASGIVSGDITNWNTAYGWGDHSLVGYLTSESDPVFSASAASGIVSGDITNWNTAYGWGDHSLVGYLTSESDPIFSASAAAGIVSGDITNWNTAYGWGDHSLVGYLTSYTETDTLATVTSRGASTTDQLSFNYNSGAPFTVLNSTVITNLNTDLLDGQTGSYYLDASNVNAGTLGTNYYSAYADLTAEGYLNNDAGGDLLTRTQSDGRYLSFQTITTTSGSSPVADLYNDTLSLTAGSNITITGDSTTDTITIAVSGITSYWTRSGTNLSPATSGDDVYLGSGELLGVGYDPTTITAGVAAFNGRIGIGTTNPFYELEAIGSSGNAVIQGTNNGIGTGVVGQTTSGTGVMGSSSTGTGVYATSGSSMGLSAYSSSDIAGYFNSNTGYSLITGNGNVGIGIATPSASLSVGGTGSAGTGIYGTGASVGIYGESGNTAIYGASTGTYGVHGQGTTGVYGYGISSGIGVHGDGDGYGIFGTTSAGQAVRGQSYGAGVGGYFSSASGFPLVVSGLSGTSSYNLVRVDTSTGNFYYDSSSEQYKKNISTLNTDFSKILQVDPKIYTDRASNQREIGFIAEELNNLGLNNLVIYKNGKPDAIKYDRVPVYLLGLMKEHEARLTSLENAGNVDISGPSISASSGTFTTLGANTITVDNITVNGNLNVTGLLTSKQIKTGTLQAYSSENIIAKLSDSIGNTSFIIQNSANQTVFSVDSSGKLSLRVDPTNPSIGGGVIPAGTTSATIYTNKVTANSRIFVTPTVKTNQQLSVVSKAANNYFKVEINSATEENITFDWWLVN